jgi:hypothetical protein
MPRGSGTSNSSCVRTPQCSDCETSTISANVRAMPCEFPAPLAPREHLLRKRLSQGCSIIAKQMRQSSGVRLPFSFSLFDLEIYSSTFVAQNKNCQVEFLTNEPLPSLDSCLKSASTLPFGGRRDLFDSLARWMTILAISSPVNGSLLGGHCRQTRNEPSLIDGIFVFAGFSAGVSACLPNS